MGRYNEYKFKEQPIYVIADIHGDFDRIDTFVKEKQVSNCIIIVAGDCGLGFLPIVNYKSKFTLINELLVSKDITMIFLRGNHDDPSYFNEEKLSFSNLLLIKDYSIISTYYDDDNEMTCLPKMSILCVGGATSIDRSLRIDRYQKRLEYAKNKYTNLTDNQINELVLPSYWSDEAPIYNEDILNSISEDKIMIDAVVTHTSPSFCFPINKDNISEWFKLDQTLEKILDEERTCISLLYDKLLKDKHPINKWVYGHFHFHNEEVINKIKFTALTNFDNMYDFVEITKPYHNRTDEL